MYKTDVFSKAKKLMKTPNLLSIYPKYYSTHPYFCFISEDYNFKNIC